MLTTLSKEQFVELLKKKKGEKTLKDFAAKECRKSFQFVGKVLTGEYFAGNDIAKRFGYEQVTVYVPRAKKRAQKEQSRDSARIQSKKPAAAK